MTDSLDLHVISELKDLLDDGFGLLVERFTDDGGQRLSQIGLAIDSQDYATIYAQAHGLKGSSRNIGAEPLAGYCEKLELLGQEQELAGSGELIAAIQAEFVLVTEALKNSMQH